MRDKLHSYSIGFILSVFLTLLAYLFVTHPPFATSTLMYTVVGLALTQLLVQLIFFLHLDHEKGQRWNLVVFISTVSVILILVVGTLSIMHNLNYHHISGQAEDTFILHDEGIKR